MNNTTIMEEKENALPELLPLENNSLTPVTSMRAAAAPVAARTTLSIAAISANAEIPFTDEEVTKIKSLQSDYQTIYNFQQPATKYDVEPILKDGVYTLGKFRSDVLSNALAQVNFFRRMCNLLPVSLSAESTDYTQCGSVAMAAIRLQGHGMPGGVKPADMPQAFWDQAVASTKASLLHSSYKISTLESHNEAYLFDRGTGNKEVGHRANLLSRRMQTIGFGYANSNPPEETTRPNYYTSVKVDNVWSWDGYEAGFITQWPCASVFPNYLTKTSDNQLFRWSIHFKSDDFVIGDNAAVTLKNERTQEILQITKTEGDQELTIVNQTPGYYPTGGYVSLVFRPVISSYESGDLYTVTVTGIKKNGADFTYSYSVRFFDILAEYQYPGVVTGVALAPASMSMVKGTQRQLTATVIPDTALNKKVTWSSANSAVASVSATGLVTAVGAGSTVITVKTADGAKTATCAVTVTATTIAVTGVSVTPASGVLEKGTTLQLTGTVSPANATNQAVNWSSSNSAVATVSAAGLVSAVSAGTATITLKSQDGAKTATSTITVDDHGGSFDTATLIADSGVTSGSIAFANDLDYFKFTATKTGTYTIVSEGTMDTQGYLYNSSKSQLAYNDDGNGNLQFKLSYALVKGQSYYIMVRGYSTRTGSYQLRITPPETVSVTGVTLSPTSKTLYLKENVQLTATVLPANATNPDITWSSSNPAVATVTQSGLVTAVSKGSTTVKITSADGSKTASCAVTVIAPAATSLTIGNKPAKNIAFFNKPVQLSVSLLPAGAENTGISWTSSAPLIATVDANGLLTAKTNGKATITATLKSNTAIKDSFEVTTDDHGNTADTATRLPFGTYATGVFDYAGEWSDEDADVFEWVVPETASYTLHGFAKNAAGQAQTMRLTAGTMGYNFSNYSTVSLKQGDIFQITLRSLTLVDPENPSQPLASTATGSRYTVVFDKTSNMKYGTLKITDANGVAKENMVKTLSVGQTMTLKGVVTGHNMVDPDYTQCMFSSSNTAVLKVDWRSGLVTALAKGSATITVSNMYGAGIIESNLRDSVVLTVA